MFNFRSYETDQLNTIGATMETRLGIYHKETDELIAFPFDDNEEGLDEAIAYAKLLNIPIKELTVHILPEGVLA